MRFLPHRAKLAPFAALLAGILAFWELAGRLGWIAPFILPAPSAIVLALRGQAGTLLGVHLPVTLLETLTGMAFSVGLGLPLAVAMHLWRPVERAVYPFLIVSQTIPLIALSPVFILWFGYSLWGKVAIVFLTAFFPIVVGTYDGLRTGGGPYRDLLRTMGAGRIRLLLKLEFPLALPSFFSALKLCAVYSVIGATIGEWLGGSAGLGFYSRRMSGQLRSADMFASILLLSLLGLALFLGTALLERIILKKMRFRS